MPSHGRLCLLNLGDKMTTRNRSDTIRADKCPMRGIAYEIKYLRLKTPTKLKTAIGAGTLTKGRAYICILRSKRSDCNIVHVNTSES